MKILDLAENETSISFIYLKQMYVERNLFTIQISIQAGPCV